MYVEVVASQSSVVFSETHYSTTNLLKINYITTVTLTSFKTTSVNIMNDHLDLAMAMSRLPVFTHSTTGTIQYRL